MVSLSQTPSRKERLSSKTKRELSDIMTEESEETRETTSWASRLAGAVEEGPGGWSNILQQQMLSNKQTSYILYI